MLSKRLVFLPTRFNAINHSARYASSLDESSLLKFAWTPRSLSLYEAHMHFKKFSEDNFAKVKEKVSSIPTVINNLQAAAEDSIREFMGTPRDLMLYESHLHYDDFIQDNFKAGDIVP